MADPTARYEELSESLFRLLNVINDRRRRAAKTLPGVVRFRDRAERPGAADGRSGRGRARVGPGTGGRGARTGRRGSWNGRAREPGRAGGMTGMRGARDARDLDAAGNRDGTAAIRQHETSGDLADSATRP